MTKKAKVDEVISGTPEPESPLSTTEVEDTNVSYDKLFMNDIMKGLIMSQQNQNQTPQNWFMNQFQGMLQPMQRPKQRSKPVYENKMVLDDKNGRNFSQVKIYVHSPTLQFPEAGIFFQAANAKGSCFIRLSSSDNLETLANFIAECKAAIDNVMPQLQAQEVAINQQFNQYQQTMKAMNSGLFQNPEDQDYQ